MGSFFLSLVLSIMLYIYPLSWKSLGAGSEELFIIYLKIFLPSALLIYPSVRFFEKINKVNVIVRLGWLFLIFGYFAYCLMPGNIYSLYVLGILFFLGISVFNSILPSLLSLNAVSYTHLTLPTILPV